MWGQPFCSAHAVAQPKAEAGWSAGWSLQVQSACRGRQQLLTSAKVIGASAGELRSYAPQRLYLSIYISIYLYTYITLIILIV